MFELVKALTELPGMVGNEGPVQKWLEARWAPHCQTVWKTGVGNLMAHVGGQGPKLLIEGHADEIGVMVSGVSDEGMVWVSHRQIGQLRPGRDMYLIGHPCVIQTRQGLVHGVYAAISGHIAPAELRNKPEMTWSDVFVDIGAASAPEVAEQGVCVGDTVVWNPPTRQVGRYIVGKAMDDRAALAIMTALLERIDPARLCYDLYLGSTVQEEMGLVGAHSLERDGRFDLAVSLDVGLAGDVPGVDHRELTARLGGGPILVHHDGRVHYDRELSGQLKDLAAKVGIPLQDAVFPRYSSDGHALIMLGVPTALIAFATRYTHSPFEMCAQRDLEQCVDLLEAFVTRPSPGR
ncbi:MAG: M42 family peptidase [Chloroflexi bacterium]|nr:M42 family peptidase [Chloroflexota bacterium]